MKTSFPADRSKQLWCITPLFPLLACLTGVAEDFSVLSDEELVKHFDDRTGYKAEFQRRLESYDLKGQEEARELLIRERFKVAHPPEEATEKALIATVRSSSTTREAHKALVELKARYADAGASEQAALYEQLRAEYRAIPYPAYGGLTPPTSEDFARLDSWRGLALVAKSCLPEEPALKLFREFYLDSGRKGAITQFLAEIEGEPFTGTPTLEALQELGKRISGYDQQKLDELGELETLGGILVTRLRQCGDGGFEALKDSSWQRSGSGVYTMGSFKNPEARALLLELYASLPDEYHQSGKRLEILTALMTHWDRERDTEFRQMLRVELTKILGMNHNENPARWAEAVQVIERTRDPWFLPKLQRCRANLDLAEMRRVTTLPGDLLEETLLGLQMAFNQAIATLEREQAGAD